MPIGNPKKRVLATVTLLCTVGAFAPERPARADYYKYTDDKGAVCITNTLDSVPPRYRKRMQVIRDETLSAKDTLKPKAPAPEQPQAAEEPATRPTQAVQPETRFGRLSARYPWVKPLVFLGAFMACFLLVVKLAAIIPSPLIARLIYLAFFLGIFLFAYKSYADYLVSGYFSAKQKILPMFGKANERQAPELGEGTGRGEEGKH